MIEELGKIGVRWCQPQPPCWKNMNWKNFPQKIFSTTSTKDKFDFATKNIQISTFMSIGTWQLPRRGIWDFSNKLAQKDWLCMLFKDHVLRNQNCSVLQYSCALFVFSVIFPLHSVDLGASGPLSCHVQMFEKPGCAPVTKKIRKTNALRGLFCLNAGEMGEGEKVKVFLQQKNRTGELELLEGQRLHPPSI